MNKLDNRFSSFVNGALRLLLALALITSLIRTVGTYGELYMKGPVKLLLVSFILIGITAVYAYAVYRCLKSKLGYKRILILILSAAFIIRLAWVMIIQTKPVSDFGIIYEYGGRFINGDYSIFKGTEYIARFTHLTMSVIYTGIFHGIFTNPLLAVKIWNAIVSTFDVLLIYLIAVELYDNKEKGLWAAFASSLFSPLIAYNSVMCTENYAMPFFLGSIYIFLLVVKGKRSSRWMLLSGFLLFFGHVFRMVGTVMLAAYVMYIIIYFGLKKAAKPLIYIIISFAIPLYLTNTLLISLDITEYSLWRGREPSITSVLRGTNIETNGTWNAEDAHVPAEYNYDYDKVEKACREIIKKRLTTTPPLKLAKFYLTKFTSEWSFGDFAGLYWSSIKVYKENAAYKLLGFVRLYTQMFYTLAVIFVYLGLYNKKQYMNNKPINLFYIMFCGFGILYLITENQSRYGYIISWLFVVLPFSGMEPGIIREKLKRVKDIVLIQKRKKVG